MNEILRHWNGLPAGEAAEAILPCNGSLAWARSLAHERPFADPAALYAAADRAWRALPLRDWGEAFASHPRLGETHAAAATKRSLNWSRGEQSSLQPEDETRAALAEGNQFYEARFGRVFLLCATGKSAAEVLVALGRRLRNDPQIELLEAAEQQRRITQLRLRKWLGEPTAACDSV